MADGVSTKPIESISAGDVTTGGVVEATMQFHTNAAAPLYHYEVSNVLPNPIQMELLRRVRLSRDGL